MRRWPPDDNYGEFSRVETAMSACGDEMFSEGYMARRLKDLKEVQIARPPRIKLSAKESLKRTKEFDKRKESFIAAVRKSKS
jgi:hypothetical protein